MAFEDCMKVADFGDYVILSDREIVSGVRHVKIPSEFGRKEAVQLVWNELPKHVETKFFLRIEWDSWIINPAMWCNEFLRYDYIGAVWPHLHGPYAVGNGGFSLRSVDLMLTLAKLELPFMEPEDAALCRQYRVLGLGLKKLTVAFKGCHYTQLGYIGYNPSKWSPPIYGNIRAITRAFTRAIARPVTKFEEKFP
jgi:Protein of unknown function (DUF5672)